MAEEFPLSITMVKPTESWQAPGTGPPRPRRLDKKPFHPNLIVSLWCPITPKQLAFSVQWVFLQNPF